MKYPSVYAQREVRVAFGADLMSDVLRYDVSQGLLITGLINPQIVRTAEMADATAILMVRGKIPQPETCKLAEQVGIQSWHPVDDVRDVRPVIPGRLARSRPL